MPFVDALKRFPIDFEAGGNPLPPEPVVQAALDAEVYHLQLSGQLRAIMDEYPDAQTREDAIWKVMREPLAKRLPERFTGLEVHVHQGVISFWFTAQHKRDKPEPAARQTISLRLAYDDHELGPRED